MAGQTLQIATSNDHAIQKDDASGFFTEPGGGVGLRATSDASRYSAGMRFPNILISQGQTVLTATLRIYVFNHDIDDADLFIHCEDVDNAANFVDTADVVGRTRTTAKTTWIADDLILEDTPAFVTSADFTSAVQEVIDRAGWAKGNALVVIMRGDSAGGKDVRFRSYDITPSQSPTILLTWSAHPKRSHAKVVA